MTTVPDAVRLRGPCSSTPLTDRVVEGHRKLWWAVPTKKLSVLSPPAPLAKGGSKVPRGHWGEQNPKVPKSPVVIGGSKIPKSQSPPWSLGGAKSQSPKVPRGHWGEQNPKVPKSPVVIGGSKIPKSQSPPWSLGGAKSQSPKVPRGH